MQDLLIQNWDKFAFTIVVLTITPLLVKTIRKSIIKRKYALQKNQYISVSLIKKEIVSHDSYLFTFQLPSLNQVLGIKTGQHIVIKQNLQTVKNPKGEDVLRKYTPTSRVNQKGTFDLLVKIYRKWERFPEGGLLTVWMETLNIGDTIKITGPSGRMDYQGKGVVSINQGSLAAVKKYNRFLMVAGGTGITPFYQIMQESVANQADKTEMILLYANKSEEDILLKKELEQLTSKNQRIKVYYTLDKCDKPEWTGFTGFITEEMMMKCFGKGDAQSLGCVCGPPIMCDLVKKHFKALVQSDLFMF